MPKGQRIGYLSLLLIAIDQLSKYLADTYLSIAESRPLIPYVLHLSLVHNEAAAFGILPGCSLLLILISSGVIIYIAAFLFRRGSAHSGPAGGLLNYSLVLILSGAAGNLIDRLRFGYVIDFIDFRVWPVFNFADSMITIGSIGLAWYLFRRK